MYTTGTIGQVVVPFVHVAAVDVDTFDTASAISVFPATVAGVVTVAAAVPPRCTTVNGDTTAGDTAIIAPCTPELEQVEVTVPVAPRPMLWLSATRYDVLPVSRAVNPAGVVWLAAPVRDITIAHEDAAAIVMEGTGMDVVAAFES